MRALATSLFLLVAPFLIFHGCSPEAPIDPSRNNLSKTEEAGSTLEPKLNEMNGRTKKIEKDVSEIKALLEQMNNALAGLESRTVPPAASEEVEVPSSIEAQKTVLESKLLQAIEAFDRRAANLPPGEMLGPEQREGMLKALGALKNVRTEDQLKEFKKKWWLWLNRVK